MAANIQTMKESWGISEESFYALGEYLGKADFWGGVAGNLLVALLFAGFASISFHVLQKRAFRNWAAKNIVPLDVFYLTLENRLARMHENVDQIATQSRSVSKESPSVPSSGASADADQETVRFYMSEEQAVSLALDLTKAEADSMCLVSCVGIWVRHANAFFLPRSTREAVWKLEECIAEFNSSLLRHSRPLAELIRISPPEGREWFIERQSMSYMGYFLGGTDRVVSTVDVMCSDADKVFGRNKYLAQEEDEKPIWTLGKRLDRMKGTINKVRECFDKEGEGLNGKALWPSFKAFPR